MPKSDAKKQSYALRREARLARLKTAAALMPWFMTQRVRFYRPPGGVGPFATDLAELECAAREAVQAADMLIAEVDRAAAPLPPPPPPGDDS